MRSQRNQGVQGRVRGLGTRDRPVKIELIASATGGNLKGPQCRVRGSGIPSTSPSACDMKLRSSGAVGGARSAPAADDDDDSAPLIDTTVQQQTVAEMEAQAARAGRLWRLGFALLSGLLALLYGYCAIHQARCRRRKPASRRPPVFDPTDREGTLGQRPHSSCAGCPPRGRFYFSSPRAVGAGALGHETPRGLRGNAPPARRGRSRCAARSARRRGSRSRRRPAPHLAL